MCYAIFNSQQYHDNYNDQIYIYSSEEYFCVSNILEKIEKGFML